MNKVGHLFTFLLAICIYISANNIICIFTVRSYAFPLILLYECFINERKMTFVMCVTNFSLVCLLTVTSFYVVVILVSFSHGQSYQFFLFSISKDFIYLFLERGEKDGDREEEKHGCGRYTVVSLEPPSGNLA